MTFERTWTVRFGDTDMFGIAYYPRIVEAISDTSDMYMESIGWSYAHISREGYGFPLVEVNVEFHNEVDATDQIRIELTQDLGESSLRFDYEGFHEGERMFEGFEQRVFVEKGGGSVPIPDEIRSALEAAED